MYFLRIYDVNREPPVLTFRQSFQDDSDAIAIADEMAKRKPNASYRVFDADENMIYAR